MSEVLKDFPVTQGGIKPTMHPSLGVKINGQTAVRFLRFLCPVHVEWLELPVATYARGYPRVPTHPAHLIISRLDRRNNRWKTVREVELPPDPQISGEGLSQQMPMTQMEAHFELIRRKAPYVIDLGDVRADHLRVECDQEYPVWPNHGECNGGPVNVPFGILDGLRAYGEPPHGRPNEPTYFPILKLGQLRPVAPRDMQVRRKLETVLFESKHLSVGFSLRRPMLMHLGWDAHGKGEPRRNRLLTNHLAHRTGGHLAGLSGPTVRTLSEDCGPHLWTGEVSVRGNRICYRHLRSTPGIVIDATFTVEPDRLIVELSQTCEKAVPVLEAEAWRLVWDLTKGITGAAALPTLKPGRNGDVDLPTLWAGDESGCLSCRLLDGPANQIHMQVESYAFDRAVSGGLVLGPRPQPEASQVIPAGTVHAAFELAVTNLQPQNPKGSPKLSNGIRRCWASVFSCFRPELGGFSNHAASVNCHVNQTGPIEVACFTRRPRVGPNPVDLARFTIGRALLDGGGYGYHRNLFQDSDPVLISQAGRIHQVEPEAKWLRRVKSGLIDAIERMMGKIGTEGLLICKDLSGNSGTYRRSTNAMDTIGFGHMDAYTNAWGYRAFRNGAALMSGLGCGDLAARCCQAAAGIRAAYAKYLVNPKTGWVAGWRSRDGRLHDYAFTWVNGPACAFGVVDRPTARKALLGLEKLRDKLGAQSARLGIPFNLHPIRHQDHVLPLSCWSEGRTEPTFEVFIDGSVSPVAVAYYLRALSIHGLKARARRLADELDEGFAEGAFTGGHGSGVEYSTWAGVAAGYEGTFSPTFGALYDIAVEKGLLTPPEPEWWPPGG